MKYPQDKMTIEDIKEMPDSLDSLNISGTCYHNNTGTTPSDTPTTRSPEDQVAEAMLKVADIDTLTTAIDRLYKNEELRTEVFGYDAVYNASESGRMMLQLQGTLHVIRMRTIDALGPLGDEVFKK